MANKNTAAVLAAINKKFTSVRKMAEGSLSQLNEVIPTGIDVVDNWILGCGGLPAGRIIEIYSEAGAGKTSTSFAFLAAAQRAGGVGVLYETERSLIPERADIFGVNREDIILAEPESMNSLLDQMKELLSHIPDGVGPNVIVWDSLAASATDNELKGKPQPGDQARQMSSNLRVMVSLLAAKRTCLVVVNQTRQNIGVVFGDSTTTPGGNALKFYASIRLALWRGSSVKEGDDVVGHRITIKSVKNKVAYPLRKCSLRLDYRDGFDNEWSTIDFAKERGLVPKGAKFTPDTFNRSLESLKQLPGWHPNPMEASKKAGQRIKDEHRISDECGSEARDELVEVPKAPTEGQGDGSSGGYTGASRDDRGSSGPPDSDSVGCDGSYKEQETDDKEETSDKAGQEEGSAEEKAPRKRRKKNAQV